MADKTKKPEKMRKVTWGKLTPLSPSSKFFQGRFKPNHPEKYLGDPTEIIYRSSWELTFLRRLDNDPNCLKYASEEIVIPYRCPFDPKGMTVRRYFPDFYVEMKQPDGKIKKYIIEIKPFAQTRQPAKKSGKQTRRMLKEHMTYAMNQAKWEAAKQFCKKHGYEFLVVTEKELGTF